MKKSSRTQAAFFHFRLVLALLLCSSGAFLAFDQPGQQSAAAKTAAAAQAKQPMRGLAEVVPIAAAVGHDKDLRDMPYIATQGEHEDKRLMRHPLAQTQGTEKFDPIVKALQSSAPVRNVPNILAQFDGVSSVQSGCGCLPPDTEGDVGPNHYIQSVNSSIKIFDKSGNPLNGVNGITYNSFFAPLGTSTPCGNGLNDGDGYVFYDHIADRWVVSDFAFPNDNSINYQCVGVSKTNDPVSGGWWLYALQIDASNPTYLGDYPKFGLWPDGYYLSVNLFDNASPPNFQGVRVFALNRAAMINGTGAPTPGAIAFTITPATLGDAYSLVPATFRTGTSPSASTAEYFMAINSSATSGTVENQVFTWRFHADFATPGNSTFGLGATHAPNGTTTVASFVDAFASTTSLIVPQSGTASNLDTLGDKLMTPLVYQNLGGTESLWSSHTINNNQNGTGPTAIRWYQFNVTGGTIPATPTQQQTFNNNADGLFRWMPSIAVDSQGNMALNYTVSSSGMNPAIRYAGRLVTDAANTLGQGEGTLIQGAGHQTDSSGRWGDYSMITIDPSDNATFWMTHEYYASTGSSSWSTRIGKFKFVNAPAPTADTSSVTADNCNSNGIIDPNETVTVSLGIKNSGNIATSNLVATLQATGGVTSPSGPQTYGTITPGATVSKSFTFTAGSVTCGSTVTATLQLQDGATNFGTITYNFQTGTTSTVLSENFDSVSAPALPSGWSATNASGAAPLWTTSNTTPDTAPNDAFIDDPATVADKDLDTPPIAISSAAAQVTFRQSYDFESGFDGGVLEMSSPNINGGAFTDITDAAVGGSFVTGGYTSTISTSYGNPIGGRSAWSGSSGGYITTTANLGPNVAGRTIKLRFRMGSDTSNSATGWRIDGVKVVGGYICCGDVGTPNVVSGGSAALTAEGFTPANGAPDPGEPVTVSLPLTNIGTGSTTNLVATLQASGGVTSPSPAQTYGALAPGGPTVSKSFSFTASGSCGGTITLTLALQDGASNLGTVTYTMTLGATTTATQTFSNATSITIPASGTGTFTGSPATPYPSNIVVSGMSGAISKVTVTLKNMSHTFPGDVDVLLVSPGGQKFIIMSDVIGGTAWTGQTYTLDDAAAGLIPSSGTPVSGTFKPTNYTTGDAFPSPAPASPYLTPATAGSATFASAFNGGNPNGTWSLYVVDDASSDVGSFGGGWSLTVTTSSPVCVSNSAPAITNGPPPSPAVVGTPYNFAFTFTGNPAPTFNVTGGTLPPGLMLSSAGVLSGNTSGGTGTYPNITVTASNGVPPDATQTFSMTTATTSTNYIASFGLSGGNAAPLFDYDGDGIANLLEYALGLNPTMASVTGLPVVTLKDYSGTKYLSMTFNRSSLATDLTYNVQVTGDLGTLATPANWTTVGSSTGGGVTSGVGFIGETGSAPSFNVEVRDTVPFDPSVTRYIRLQVTSP